MLAAVVLGVVLSVNGPVLEVDRGSSDGLEVGDAGRVYYQLTVGSRRVRIDVGVAEAVEVSEKTALFRLLEPSRVQPGYSVELDIVPSPPVPAAPPPDEPKVPPAQSNMITVPAGSYSIGTELEEARYYNQHPRFEVRLEAFRIDRAPVSGPDGGPLTVVTFQAAESHCRALGKRLPTEFEWEVAAAQAVVALAPRDMSEWTSSWYQPYPGNTVAERQYGERYRVLRGPEVHRRYFMLPAAAADNVGFRCAGGAAP